MQRFPIGTRYKSRNGKVQRECEVVDFLITTNLAGEVVRIAYVTQHEFLGQMVRDYDVCDTTIARGLLPEFVLLLK